MHTESVVVGGIYQHYTGKLYKIRVIALHTETKEPLVVYQALYADEKYGDQALWVRPLEMFLENIVINNKSQPRFSFKK